MFKEELLNLIDRWTVEQLTNYIDQLEMRVTDTYVLIKELKRIRKKKMSHKTPDNGPRSGV